MYVAWAEVQLIDSNDKQIPLQLRPYIFMQYSILATNRVSFPGAPDCNYHTEVLFLNPFRPSDAYMRR